MNVGPLGRGEYDPHYGAIGGVFVDYVPIVVCEHAPPYTLILAVEVECPYCSRPMSDHNKGWIARPK